MGGTALLEELLAEQAAKDAAQDLGASAHHMNNGNSGPSRSSTASGVSGVAAVAPAAPIGYRRGNLTVPPLPIMQASYGGGCNDEHGATPTSPLSMQIAELAREMDDCLGTLDQWEDDKRRYRENLLSELEAQYADYGLDAIEEASLAQSMLQAQYADYGLDASEEASLAQSMLQVDHGTPDLISPLGPGPQVSSAEVLYRLREADHVAKCSDEARISQLRAEVEDMRMKAGDSDSVTSPYAVSAHAAFRHLPGTPHPGVVLDASLSGLDSNFGLQAWCEEVDAALGEQTFEDELRDGDFSPRGLAVMEGQLLGARERVRLLEDAVESAQACAQDELGELDQLLSECEELHTRLMERGAEDGGPPLLRTSLQASESSLG